MGIRKPSLTVSQARRMAETRSATGMVDADIPSTETPTSAPSRPHLPGALQKPVPSTPEDVKKPDDMPRAASVPARNTMPKPARIASTAPGKSNSESYLKSLLPSRADKVQVFISALLPAPGVSPVYETLCRQYQPQKALQMVLRRALHDYEAMLASGAFENAPTDYAVDETARIDDFVQTSRMMQKSLVGIARAHFDPLGLESTRSFGRKLANAALANFFARETANS